MKQLPTLVLILLFPFLVEGQALFTKITDPNNPAVTFTNTGAPYKGVAWIDLNDDNLPDLFANQYFLFQNNGNAQFTRLTDLNGASLGQAASGSSWGDLDNDGDLDCITSGLASGLHLNNGDQTFSLGNSNLPGFGNYSAWDCALADADNNGRLDLLFVHANNFHSTGPFPCKLFLQDSVGAFSSIIAGYEFTTQLAPYTIPIWADYDLDGDMDLFIGAGPAGTPGPDFCYKNMLSETGSFSLQRLTSSPFNLLEDGQTYNFPDFDNDGDLDICLTNYGGVANRFWRNDNGAYTSITTPFTVKSSHLANVWGDVDNDGDLDVLITSDASSIRLYRNKGDGTFDIGKLAGISSNNMCGVALADFDNDGDLDFYTNGGNEGRGLYRNDTLATGRNWVSIKLEGTQSNRSAIGATIRLKAQINGGAIWQIRQVQAHNSFQSQSDFRQHFGLADATVIDSVEVRWPSGAIEQFAGLAANNFYKIVEGQGLNLLTQTTSVQPAIKVSIQPNPGNQVFQISAGEGLRLIDRIQVFDVTGQLIPVSVSPGNQFWQIKFENESAPGLYFLRIEFADRTSATAKIIKK